MHIYVPVTTFISERPNSSQGSQQLYLTLSVFLKITLISISEDPHKLTATCLIGGIGLCNRAVLLSCSRFQQWLPVRPPPPVVPDSRLPITRTNITSLGFPPRTLGCNVKSSQALKHIVKLAQESSTWFTCPNTPSAPPLDKWGQSCITVE